jgi:hypothetical protein
MAKATTHASAQRPELGLAERLLTRRDREARLIGKRAGFVSYLILIAAFHSSLSSLFEKSNDKRFFWLRFCT